jgi:uncharacterized protein (TIGR02594 family)
MSILRMGSRGPQVSLMQGLLNSRGASPRLRQDGDFGARTDRAVRAFQTKHGLEVDGIVGSRTWSALVDQNIIAGRATPRVTPVAQRPLVLPSSVSTPADRSAPWMDVARAEMGVREIAGSRHNSRIVEYHAATTLRATSDEVPWCASFVNWVLRESGKRGTNSAAAASFLDWGTTLASPRAGAVVVIRHTTSGNRGSTGSSSGNHVGFFLSASPSHISILGGNQSDQVKVSNFNLSSFAVRGYRWPI